MSELYKLQVTVRIAVIGPSGEAVGAAESTHTVERRAGEGHQGYSVIQALVQDDLDTATAEAISGADDLLREHRRQRAETRENDT